MHVTVLTLLASISPLLTFAALWQVKEWRLDRLGEHLGREGWLRQIFGITRPAVLAIFGVLGALGFSEWVLGALISLSVLTLVQLGLRKQKMPKWTRKAEAIIALSIALTYIATLPPTPYSLLPLIPLLQSLSVFSAWLILFPIDQHLKLRIMQYAKRVRERCPEMQVIGITGSVGKTTTKLLLEHILAERQPLVTPEYVNAEIGVARWIIEKLGKSEADIAIVEMGAYRTGEIEKICDFVQPTIGIITFVGTQHMSLFGSEEKICQAKGELIAALPKDGTCFLNADSSLCAEIGRDAACKIVTIGTAGKVDLEAREIEETSEGIRFRIEDTVFMIPLHGTHNVTNALLAIACAEKLGMGRKDIATRLRSFVPPQHTFSMQKRGSITILDDTHNSSPMSFKSAIVWARSQPEEPKILLSSGLIELGPNQDRIHSDLGTYATNVFNRVIFVSRTSGKQFERGFQKEVEIVGKGIEKIPEGALLVCIGRMPKSTIEQLLPNL